MSVSNPIAEPTKASRQFKGLALEERQKIRREKLIDAGLQTYGTLGFFSVTIKDICKEAKLTERYFYESFKRSEELFQAVYLELINDLQQRVVKSVTENLPSHEKMIDAGLTTLFTFLKDDPRIARILFIDAVLVHELHGKTIHESISLFDKTISEFLTLLLPQKPLNKSQTIFIASGLNGYVSQVAMRWVTSDFKYPIEDVLAACKIAYLGITRLLESQKP